MSAGRFILVKNDVTDEQLVIDRYFSRYRRLGYAFLNSMRLHRRFVKHVTLTQRTESYSPNFLNNFFNSMRRYYKDIIYIWTAEIQQKRLERTGETVLHYHVMIGFPYEDFVFGRNDVLRIQQYWKYGNADVRPVFKPSMDYLMKYIQKSLDADVVDLFGFRRIGSSRLAAFLRQSWKNVKIAMGKFASWGVSSDFLSSLTWTNGNAWVVCEGRERICVYRKPPSGWSLVCSMDTPDSPLF